MALDVVQSPLDTHRWRHRVLVVHDAGQPAPWLDTQVEALRKAHAGNVERDLVVWVCRNGDCDMDTDAGVDASGLKLDSLGAQSALKIRVPSVVLVGKDGGEKLRREGFIDVAEVHRTIDAMPMRQNEMRRTGS